VQEAKDFSKGRYDTESKMEQENIAKNKRKDGIWRSLVDVDGFDINCKNT